MGWVQDEKFDYYGVSLKNSIFRWGRCGWVNEKLIYRGNCLKRQWDWTVCRFKWWGRGRGLGKKRGRCQFWGGGAGGGGLIPQCTLWQYSDVSNLFLSIFQVKYRVRRRTLPSIKSPGQNRVKGYFSCLYRIWSSALFHNE